MLKLGCVPYINARPLVTTLEVNPGIALTYDAPSLLAEGLSVGRFDAALLPVVEIFRYDHFHLVPGVAIGSRGRIGSVRLFHKRPLPECRRIALDRHSATSNALLQILLRDRFGLAPTFEPADPTTGSLHRSDFDAFLAIGDAAFLAPYQELPSLDLGQAWDEWQRMPFVFAAWATARPGGLGNLAATFVEARDAGLVRAPALADEAAQRFGLDAAFLRDYLTRLVRYDLGKPEEAGMQRFNELASGLMLCPRRTTLPEYRG